MTDVIRVGALGIVGVLLAIQFKGHKPEYGVYIAVGISILIFYFALKQIQAVMNQIASIHDYLGGNREYLSILLRVLGITYVCEFSAGMCKDAGFGAVADQIEVLGKVFVMIAGLPILFAVINQIQTFL